MANKQLEDYNLGLQAGLEDAREGMNNLAPTLRYIQDTRPDIDIPTFTRGYTVGQANVNSRC